MVLCVLCMWGGGGSRVEIGGERRIEYGNSCTQTGGEYCFFTTAAGC